MSKILPCIDCKHEFELSESEVEFYTSTITDKKTGKEVQMQLPKRCSDCREKNKQKKLQKGY